jgi:hypothetical protein
MCQLAVVPISDMAAKARVPLVRPIFTVNDEACLFWLPTGRLVANVTTGRKRALRYGRNGLKKDTCLSELGWKGDIESGFIG